MRMIYCQKLKAEKEGLESPPFPNALGQKIYDHISKDAWKAWLEHQTRVVNEGRLSFLNADHRKLLQTEMTAFLFEGKTPPPPPGFKS